MLASREAGDDTISCCFSQGQSHLALDLGQKPWQQIINLFSLLEMKRDVLETFQHIVYITYICIRLKENSISM